MSKPAHAFLPEEPSEARDISSSHKFAQMSMGHVSQFYKGLDDFIGPPNPNVREAMAFEHCNGRDARVPFTVKNYMTKTTSCCEWYFVVEPNDAGFQKARTVSEAQGEYHMPGWPKEQQMPGASNKGAERARTRAGLRGGRSRGRADSRSRSSFNETPKMRELRPISSFERSINEVNFELQDIKESPIKEIEFIGGRLYTGPMYQKYNGVLRCIGELRVRTPEHLLCGSKIEEELERRSDIGTMGNIYTTTLHVINSVCIKLGKIAKAGKVYRGVRGMELPQGMRTTNKYKFKGGIEFGFMSASRDRHVAENYASAHGAEPSIVFEMAMGMIDRGADLGWLSQYPHEREILFAPLSALEIIASGDEQLDAREGKFHRDDCKSKPTTLQVRLSINLHGQAIEEVVAKMKRSHLQLIDMMQESLRFASVPERLREPLQQLKLKASYMGPEVFNVAKEFRRFTQEALEAQEEVFHKMTDPASWEDDKGGRQAINAKRIRIASTMLKKAGEIDQATRLQHVADRMEATLNKEALRRDFFDGQVGKMRRAAMLCARTGEHQDAAKLLRMAAATHLIACATCDDEGDTIDGWRLDGSGPEAFGEPSQEECAQIAIQTLINAERLLPPSPGTIVELLKVDSTSDTEKHLIDVIIDNIRPLVQPDPFADPGTEVLAWFGEHARWEKARLVRAWNTKVDAADGRTEPGAVTKYEVANWKMHVVQKKHLLAPPSDTSGPAALLREAAKRGNVNLVRALLEANVSVSECDASADTALTLAARYGHASVCDVLLKAGAWKSVRNIAGSNAFDLANRHGHIEVMRKLNPTDSDLDYKDHIEMVADMNLTVKKSRGLWYEAPTLGSRNKKLLTQLMLACRESDDDGVTAALDAGVDVLAQTSRGCSALTMACEDSSLEIIDQLLNKNATSHHLELKIDRDQSTAIFVATKAGRRKVVKLLVEKGARVDGRLIAVEDGVAQAGKSLLHVAAMYGHCSVVEYLLDLHDAKLDINAQNHKAETPLMLACRFGHSRVAKLLLSHGCDVQAETARGLARTSLHRACQYGHLEVASALLDHEMGISEGHPRLLNHQNEDGFTPLMLAVLNNHSEIILFLLQRSADTSISNKRGESALYIAASSGNQAALKVLLDGRGADANQQDGCGYTPLMAACKNGHEATVRLLLKAGAALDGGSWWAGTNALLLATEAGHVEIVRMLLHREMRCRIADANRIARSKLEAAREHEKVKMEDAKKKNEVQAWVSAAPKPACRSDVSRYATILEELSKKESKRSHYFPHRMDFRAAAERAKDYGASVASSLQLGHVVGMLPGRMMVKKLQQFKFWLPCRWLIAALLLENGS